MLEGRSLRSSTLYFLNHNIAEWHIEPGQKQTQRDIHELFKTLAVKDCPQDLVIKMNSHLISDNACNELISYLSEKRLTSIAVVNKSYMSYMYSCMSLYQKMKGKEIKLFTDRNTAMQWVRKHKKTSNQMRGGFLVE